MIKVHKTEVFEAWLSNLRDRLAKALVIKRIDRLANGNFGQWRSLGDGLAELKIDFGPGYRVYYASKGSSIVLLLCGGDKSSQERDIARAKLLAAEVNWEEIEEWH